jgi:hypothetical protein
MVPTGPSPFGTPIKLLSRTSRTNLPNPGLHPQIALRLSTSIGSTGLRNSPPFTWTGNCNESTESTFPASLARGYGTTGRTAIQVCCEPCSHATESSLLTFCARLVRRSTDQGQRAPHQEHHHVLQHRMTCVDQSVMLHSPKQAKLRTKHTGLLPSSRSDGRDE